MICQRVHHGSSEHFQALDVKELSRFGSDAAVAPGKKGGLSVPRKRRLPAF